MEANQDILVDLGDQNLQFQNYYGDSSSPENYTIPPAQLESDAEVGAEAHLLGSSPDGEGESRTITSFWTFEFYQQFFDVNTSDVLKRIQSSVLPRPGFNFLEQVVAGKPDLYGPFWICVTLVFSIAITGNLAQYFQAAAAGYRWRYDFHVVSIAATIIFMYAWLVPFLVWAALKWMGSTQGLPILDLICLYGYSLAVYVPVSFLWVVQLWWLQWVFVIGGACLSGAVLLSAVWPSAKSASSGRVVLLTMLCAHLLFAAGFMLYFYHAQPALAPVTPIPHTPVPHNVTEAPKVVTNNTSPSH